MAADIEFCVMLRLADGRSYGPEFVGIAHVHKGQIETIHVPTLVMRDRCWVRQADHEITPDHWLWQPLASAIKQSCADTIADEARNSCSQPQRPLSPYPKMRISDFI